MISKDKQIYCKNNVPFLFIYDLMLLFSYSSWLLSKRI